jgi:hypothetical protein
MIENRNNGQNVDAVAQTIFDLSNKESLEERMANWHGLLFTCAQAGCKVDGKPFEATAHRKVTVGGRNGKPELRLPALWVNVMQPVLADGRLNVACQHCQRQATINARRAKMEEIMATRADECGSGSQQERETKAWTIAKSEVSDQFVSLEQVMYRLEQLVKVARDPAAATALEREGNLVVCAISGKQIPIKDAMAAVTYVNCTNIREEPVRGRKGEMRPRWDQARGFVLEVLIEDALQGEGDIDDDVADIIQEVNGVMQAARDQDDEGRARLHPVYFRRDLARKFETALIAFTGERRWAFTVTVRNRETGAFESRTHDRVFEQAVRVTERIVRSEQRNEAVAQRETKKVSQATATLKDVWNQRRSSDVVVSDEDELATA